MSLKFDGLNWVSANPIDGFWLLIIKVMSPLELDLMMTIQEMEKQLVTSGLLKWRNKENIISWS